MLFIPFCSMQDDDDSVVQYKQKPYVQSKLKCNCGNVLLVFLNEMLSCYVVMNEMHYVL